MRNFIAENLPPAFVQLQRSGLFPDPLKSKDARRLGNRSPRARYDETILGTKQARSTPISTDICPDDESGQRYTRLLEGAVHEAETDEYFGFFDVPDVKIWAEYGVHTSPAGNFNEVYCGNALNNPKYELARRALQVRATDCYIREGVFLAPAWSHNFYHWTIDIVPRLELVAGFLRQGLPLIVPPKLRGWQRAALQAVIEGLGLAGIEVIEPQYGVTHFERLVMPTNITHPHDISLQQLKLLRRSRLRNVSDVGSKRRLYISRRDAANRRIRNEGEVCAQLQRRQFEVISMSEFTPAEQAALVHRAEVVIGSHGAALTNLVFCQEGATAIEIFRDGHFAPCFGRIAQSVELNYGFGVGKPAGADIHLDLAQLHRLLDIAGV